MLGNGLRPWRSRFIYSLNTHFLSKNPYPLCLAKLIGDYFDNKMPEKVETSH
jgi:hypothetical protein